MDFPGFNIYFYFHCTLFKVESQIRAGDVPSNVGSIPANTQLQTSLQVIAGSEDKPAYVELTVRTTNDTIVKCVMIFAEGKIDYGLKPV